MISLRSNRPATSWTSCRPNGPAEMLTSLQWSRNIVPSLSFRRNVDFASLQWSRNILSSWLFRRVFDSVTSTLIWLRPSPKHEWRRTCSYSPIYTLFPVEAKHMPYWKWKWNRYLMSNDLLYINGHTKLDHDGYPSLNLVSIRICAVWYLYFGKMYMYRLSDLINKKLRYKNNLKGEW